MFARRRPQKVEAVPPASFEQLGYHLAANGVVEANVAGPYQYRTFRREEVNEQLHEALQKAARRHVFQQLDQYYNVKPVGITGTQILENSDDQLHVDILATDPDQLITKNVVIIFCGPSDHELGIIARPGILGERGINQSSILDLVAHACMTHHMHDFKKHKTVVSHEYIQKNHMNMKDHMSQQDRPGIIVLNPGQLVYSHESNTTFSHRSWFTRRSSTNPIDNYNIDDKHNFITGHKTAAEHVETFFTHILQRMVKTDVKLCLIGVADGAEHMVSAIDKILTQEPRNILKSQLGRSNLVATTHKHGEIKSASLKTHLASAGVAWELSEVARGKLLKLPERMPAEYYSNGLCITDKPHAAPVPVPFTHTRSLNPFTSSAIARDFEKQLANRSSPVRSRSHLIDPANPWLSTDTSLSSAASARLSSLAPSVVERGVFSLDPMPEAQLHPQRGSAQRQERPNVTSEQTTSLIDNPEYGVHGLDMTMSARFARSSDPRRRYGSMSSLPSLALDRGSLSTFDTLATPQEWDLNVFDVVGSQTDKNSIGRGSNDPADLMAGVPIVIDDSSPSMTSASLPETSSYSRLPVAFNRFRRSSSSMVPSVSSPGFPEDFLSPRDKRFHMQLMEFDGNCEWTADPTRAYPTNLFHREWAEYDPEASCPTVSAGADIVFRDQILGAVLPDIMMDIADMRH